MIKKIEIELWFIFVMDSFGNTWCDVVTDTSDKIHLYGVKDQNGDDVLLECESYHLDRKFCEDRGMIYFSACKTEKFELSKNDFGMTVYSPPSVKTGWTKINSDKKPHPSLFFQDETKSFFRSHFVDEWNEIQSGKYVYDEKDGGK